MGKPFSVAAFVAKHGQSKVTTVKVDGHTTKLTGFPKSFTDDGLAALVKESGEDVRVNCPKVETETGKVIRPRCVLSADKAALLFKGNTATADGGDEQE